MTFKQAVEYAKIREVISEKCGNDNSYIITFSDGTSLKVASRYDDGYSEVTPGEGIQLPEFVSVLQTNLQ